MQNQEKSLFFFIRLKQVHWDMGGHFTFGTFFWQDLSFIFRTLQTWMTNFSFYEHFRNYIKKHNEPTFQVPTTVTHYETVIVTDVPTRRTISVSFLDSRCRNKTTIDSSQTYESTFITIETRKIMGLSNQSSNRLKGVE